MSRQPPTSPRPAPAEPAQRLFIALPLPAAVRERLAALQQTLRAADQLVRWVEPEMAHLTLQFLGATPPGRLAALQTALAAVAERRPPFTLRTASLGRFPTAAARTQVLWLGLAGELDGLMGLQATITAATAPLGYVEERRAYVPHLTLGRVRPLATAAERQTLARLLATTDPPAPVGWTVDALVLMASRLTPARAHYTTLVGWSLTGGQ